MRQGYPGEVLREDFLRPSGLSVNALAKALHVPPPRINDVVRERRGVTADTAVLEFPGDLGVRAAFNLGGVDAGKYIVRFQVRFVQQILTNDAHFDTRGRPPAELRVETCIGVDLLRGQSADEGDTRVPTDILRESHAGSQLRLVPRTGAFGIGYARRVETGRLRTQVHVQVSVSGAQRPPVCYL